MTVREILTLPRHSQEEINKTELQSFVAHYENDIKIKVSLYSFESHLQFQYWVRSSALELESFSLSFTYIDRAEVQVKYDKLKKSISTIDAQCAIKLVRLFFGVQVPGEEK